MVLDGAKKCVPNSINTYLHTRLQMRGHIVPAQSRVPKFLLNPMGEATLTLTLTRSLTLTPTHSLNVPSSELHTHTLVVMRVPQTEWPILTP